MSLRRTLDLSYLDAGGGGDCLFLSVACLIYKDEDALTVFCSETGNDPRDITSHKGLLAPLRNIVSELVLSGTYDDMIRMSIELYGGMTWRDIFGRERRSLHPEMRKTWVHAVAMHFGGLANVLERYELEEITHFVAEAVQSGFAFGLQFAYTSRAVPVWGEQLEVTCLRDWLRTHMAIHLEATSRQTAAKDVAKTLSVALGPDVDEAVQMVGFVVNKGVNHYQALYDKRSRSTLFDAERTLLKLGGELPHVEEGAVEDDVEGVFASGGSGRRRDRDGAALSIACLAIAATISLASSWR